MKHYAAGKLPNRVDGAHASAALLLAYSMRNARVEALLMQVIPTVGVNSDEDGKAAASQLRHFRNLIDNTASKKRFLSGFQKQVRAQLILLYR